MYIIFFFFYILRYFFFFFFSSRRRHTRCLSDWSSDVCSSDLPRVTFHLNQVVTPALDLPELRERSIDMFLTRISRPFSDGDDELNMEVLFYRSEERRVGKECRSRGSAYQYKKRKKKEVTNGGT